MALSVSWATQKIIWPVNNWNIILRGSLLGVQNPENSPRIEGKLNKN